MAHPGSYRAQRASGSELDKKLSGHPLGSNPELYEEDLPKVLFAVNWFARSMLMTSLTGFHCKVGVSDTLEVQGMLVTYLECPAVFWFGLELDICFQPVSYTA